MDPNLGYGDTEGELAMSYRWEHLRNKKTIRTAVPGITIIAGTDSAGYDYYAFLVKNGFPQGYARFAVRSNVPSWWYKVVYTPHSYVRKGLRGLGYISSLYKWFLSSGRALLSSYEHSADASSLWKGLTNKYPHVFVTPDDSSISRFRIVGQDDKSANTAALIAAKDVLEELIKGL
jgi:hypothetical protein